MCSHTVCCFHTVVQCAAFTQCAALRDVNRMRDLVREYAHKQVACTLKMPDWCTQFTEPEAERVFQVHSVTLMAATLRVPQQHVGSNSQSSSHTDIRHLTRGSRTHPGRLTVLLRLLKQKSV